jgi:hypothetical protein
MRHGLQEFGWALLATLFTLFGLQGVAYPQQSAEKTSSYLPVDIKESFATILARMQAAKAEVMKRQMDLLNERYDYNAVDRSTKQPTRKLSSLSPVAVGKIKCLG